MNIEKIETPLNSKKDITEIINYLQVRQKALEMLSPYRSEVGVDITDHLPQKVLHIGDTHLGHDHADPTALVGALKHAGKDDLIILHANIFDGVSSKFIRNNTTRIGLDLDGQRKLTRAILKDKKIVPVSANTCHEGWASKTATHDPTTLIVDDDTPVLFSGGQVIFKEKGRELGRVEAYHNPGYGNTQQSPEGAARARYREIPAGETEAPDAIVTAHTHRLVAGQDMSKCPITREDRTITLGVVGAAKGTKDNPDEFLISKGVPPRNQPADAGQGLVTIWKYNDKKNHLESYPVANYDRADFLYGAVVFWELVRRAGALDDLKNFVQESGVFQKPTKNLIDEKSLTRPADEAAQSEGVAPLYKTLSYEVDSNLPLSIQFIGNTRVGSTSFQREVVKNLLGEIENDPWRFWVATRRLINQSTAQFPSREDTLADLADVLKDGRSSLLGIMLTDELRRHSWAKKIGHGEDSCDPIYPGDWLYYQSSVKGIPLIMPETVLNIDLSKQSYVLYLRDKLSHLTSMINPFHGLTRISEIWGIKADALIGGHTEVVGWRTWMRPWGQLEVVVPGGFSEYIEKGIGNRVDYPTGGQGLVVFPDKKRLYSFSSMADLKDYHQALWLYDAVNQLDGLGKISMRDLRKKIKQKSKKSGNL